MYEKTKINVRKKKSRDTRYYVSFWLFILPCAALFVLFFVVPLFLNIINSFFNYDGFRTREFIGFSNYVQLFSDRDFYNALYRTLMYTVVSLPFKIFIPLGLAALLVSKTTKLKTITRSLIYLPVLLSSLVVGLTINWMFSEQYGLVNYLLQQMGMNGINWATEPFFARLLVIIASTWASTGFYMLIYIGALNGVSEDVYEAAQIDGANTFKSFFKITIPLIKPTTFLVSLLSIISLLKEYALVQGITRGGPGTATTYVVQYILTTGFDQSKHGYASAASVVVMLIFAMIALIQYKFTNGGELND